MHEEILIENINRSKEYYYQNKEHICKYQKTFQKTYCQKFRNIVLNAYGNKCQCCGEITNEFLAIDHINGNGKKHKNDVVKNCGTQYYRWIIRNNFPKDLQILCHNCNMAKGFYGKCPHEDKKCI